MKVRYDKRNTILVIVFSVMLAIRAFHGESINELILYLAFALLLAAVVLIHFLKPYLMIEDGYLIIQRAFKLRDRYRLNELSMKDDIIYYSSGNSEKAVPAKKYWADKRDWIMLAKAINRETGICNADRPDPQVN